MFNYFNVHAVSLKFYSTTNSYGQTLGTGSANAAPVAPRIMCGLFEPNSDNSYDATALFNHPRARKWVSSRSKTFYCKIKTPITVSMGNTTVDLKLRRKPLVSTVDINADWGNFWLTKSSDNETVHNVDNPLYLEFTYYVRCVGFSSYRCEPSK